MIIEIVFQTPSLPLVSLAKKFKMNLTIFIIGFQINKYCYGIFWMQLSCSENLTFCTSMMSLLSQFSSVCLCVCVFVQDSEKRTPLHAAAYLGDAKIIELLIVSGMSAHLHSINTFDYREVIHTDWSQS